MKVEKMAVSSHFVDKTVDKWVLFSLKFLEMPVDFVDNFSGGC